MMKTSGHIAFIGFGEAGQAFASGFAEAGIAPALQAYDIKTDGSGAAAMHAAFARHEVVGASKSAAVCEGAQAIFSLVTAEEAGQAAKAAAQSRLEGALYLDCNSCAPDTKRQSAEVIEAAGGRHVDVAVMTPVHPRRHKAPCLLAGPHAQAAQDLMQSLGMNVEIAGDQIGDASSRKMIRSVMVKGLEALTLECFLAARKYGIEDDIMASLDASYPGFDWPTRAPYMIERAMTHGIRRAAEMREVEKTLLDLGIDPLITRGTVARQDQVGTMGLDAGQIGETDLKALTDAVLARLDGTPGRKT